MKDIKTHARGKNQLRVRRDRRRAPSQMTKSDLHDGFNPSQNYNTPSDQTGNWRAWWHWGCGSIDGKPMCEPGHAYHTERYRRGEHRRAKILGRRRERRKNKMIDMDE